MIEKRCDKTPKWCDVAPLFALSGDAFVRPQKTTPVGSGFRPFEQGKRQLGEKAPLRAIVGLGFASKFIISNKTRLQRSSDLNNCWVKDWGELMDT